MNTSDTIAPVKNVDWGTFRTGAKIDISRCIIFKPDGQMVSASKKNMLICLTEASYSPADMGTSAFEFKPKYPLSNGSSTVRSENIILDINAITGKVRLFHLNMEFNGKES